MAKFNNIILTDKGLNLIAETEAGKTLIFTKAELGDGDLLVTDNVQTFTDIKSVKLTLPFDKVSLDKNGQCTVRFTVDNTTLDAGFFAKEVGIFAKAGTDGKEYLYAYSNAGNFCDYVPDKSTPTSKEIFKITLVTGNTANVTAILDKNIDYYTLDQAEDMVADTKKDLADVAKNTAKEAIQSEVDKYVTEKMAAKQDKLQFDYKPISNSLHPVTSDGIYNAIEAAKPDLSPYAKKADLTTVATSGKYTDLQGIPHIPAKVSELTNDAGYLTKHQDISAYAKKTEIPTKVSQLQNDSGYLTSHQDLSEYAKKGDIPTGFHTLTFTGNADATYDGSQNVTISIPKAVDLTPYEKQNHAYETFETKAHASSTYALASAIGVANGIATLDDSGLVPSSQLPSYVDDVLEFDSKDKFPVNGEDGKIYVDKSDNKTYRYTGSGYLWINSAVATADEAVKAHKDADGNVITDTYEKKTDAAASLATKQDKLTIDSTFSETSDNVATSKGIAAYVKDSISNAKIDPSQIAELSSYEKKTDAAAAHSSLQNSINGLSTGKQDKLIFDTIPTANSNNPVTSKGIKAALDNKLNKTGDTATGAIIAPSFQTGNDDNNYFQCRKFRGEGNANTYYHAIDFGYSTHNQVDFYEYGGIWNFWKNTTSTKGGTLVGSIKPSGWNGNVVGNVTGNADTATTATKLQTPRTLSLTGNAAGSATFDGSADISINTTVNESKHAVNADVVHKAIQPRGVYGVGKYIFYGTLTIPQSGDFFKLEVLGGNGYNSRVEQSREGTLYFRTGNGDPASYAAYSEYHRNGATNFEFFVVEDSGTQYRIYSGVTGYTGTMQVIPYVGQNSSFDLALTTVSALPDGAVKVEQQQLIYANTVSAYAPTKTGDGASGTWNINISGTATKANQDASGNVITDTYATKTEVAAKADKAALKTVATTGSYNDLINKPTIPIVPTKVSAFTNDAGYATKTYVDQKVNDGLYSIQKIMDIVYPVGSIWETTTDDDPNKKWTGTTWVKMDAGRVLVSAGSYTENGTTYTYNLGDKGGEVKHQSTVNEMPSHSHDITSAGDHTHLIVNDQVNGGSGLTNKNYLIKKCTWNSYENFELIGSGKAPSIGLTSSSGSHTHSIASTGGNKPHENRQPYLVINRWQRTK